MVERLDSDDDSSSDDGEMLTGLSTLTSMPSGGVTRGLKQPTEARTMVLPKGRVNEADLFRQIEQQEQYERPAASHQMPKGQLKASELNKNMQKKIHGDKLERPNTIDLLKGLYETADQRERRERALAEKKIARMREKQLAEQKQAPQSKIGRGVNPENFSKSPLRQQPAGGVPKAAQQPSRLPSRIGSISPSKIPSPRGKAGPKQKMFGAPPKSPSGIGGGLGSKIGQGFRRNISPVKSVEKQPAEMMKSAHFGAAISPVGSDEDESAASKKTQATKTVDSKGVSGAEKATKMGVFAFVKEADRKSLQTPLDEKAESPDQKSGDLPIYSPTKDQGADSDHDSSLKGDDDHFKNLLGMDETEDAAAKEEKDKATDLEDLSYDENKSPAKETTVLEHSLVNVDLLKIVKTIKRRTKADLINEMQRELDLIDQSIIVDDEIPAQMQEIEDNLELKKYHPEKLAEWEFEFKKLEQTHVAPEIDLLQFDEPFIKDLNLKTDETDFATDDMQDRLRKDLQKVQHDIDNIDVEVMSMSSDSMDLLKGDVDFEDQFSHASQILDDFEDSPSHELPRPAALTEHIADESSSLLPIEEGSDMRGYSADESGLKDELPQTEDVDDEISKKDFEKQQIERIASLQQIHMGELDTLTEHQDQEDMLSQIDALNEGKDEWGSRRSKRPSVRESTRQDLLAEINGHERQEQRRGRKDNLKVMQYASQAFQPGSFKSGAGSIILNPGKEQHKGLESLAIAASKRPRSLSQSRDNKGESDLFDTDSEAFSALNQSKTDESSIHISSRDNSPMHGESGFTDSTKDVDNLDVSLISLTKNDREFQRLVDEAKAEKQKKKKPLIQIDTIMEDEESKIDPRESTNSLQLNKPKPLPNPKSKAEQEKQKMELRELVTYKKQDEPKDESFIDTIPKANNRTASVKSDFMEPTISNTSLLSLLITDSSLKKARTAHLYICEDRELTKSRVGLKILYEQLAKQGEVIATATVLLKISKVYFCLNNLKQATETMSQCVEDFKAGGEEPPSEAIFWKGLIYFYYLYTKRVKLGSRKIPDKDQPSLYRELSQMINSCEQSLVKASTDKEYKIVAKFLLLKLTLFISREKFGCGLVYISQQPALKIAQSIQHDDYYYGQIAMSECHVDGQTRKPEQAFEVLKTVIDRYPRRGEAYIKLWQLNMFMGNQLLRSQSQQQRLDQRTQSLVSSKVDLNASQRRSDDRSASLLLGSERSFTSDSLQDDSFIVMARNSCEVDMNNAEIAKKYYAEAYQVVSKLLQNCDEQFASSPQQQLLLVFLSVKSLQKSGMYIQAFELLQRQFAENPAITSLMYLYGKYVVKAMASEVHDQLAQMAMTMSGTGPIAAYSPPGRRMSLRKKGKQFRIDQGYLGSGIGALEECLRSCFEERFPKVNYYIGFAYKVLRMPLKTEQFYKKAKMLHSKQRTLSAQQSSQVAMFLKEQSFFTIIGENANQMIAEKQGLKKSTSKHTEQTRKNMVREYMSSMQKIEKIDMPNSLLFQARMEAYLIESSSKVDETETGQAFERLLEQFPTFIDGYIHYWKYLKFRMSQQQQKRSSNARGPQHADEIVLSSGKKILEKMRECATNALMHSDATEVPTSLWVEARIIFAKQMIFEKDVGNAISILKDIAYIIPPYPIPGLSFVQQMTEEEEDSDMLESSEISLMTADQMFNRQADMIKARNSPTRQRINKDAPMFQKKTFNQSMFGGGGVQSQQVLPKGKINFEQIMGLDKQQSFPQSQKYPKGKFELVPKRTSVQLSQDLNQDDDIMLRNPLLAEMEEAEKQSVAGLDTIEEETKSDAHASSQMPTVPNKHFEDAFQMLKQMDQLNEKDVKKGRQRVGSLKGNQKSALNRMTMYRKQPQQQRTSQHFGNMTTKAGHSKNRSLTIYNPFNFDQKVVAKAGRDQSQTMHGVSQSVDFQNQPINAQLVPGAPTMDAKELAYQALLKAQMAWQEQNRIDEISETQSSSTLEDSYNADRTDGPVVESENFAIFSDFRFLQLIGKYCAKTKQYSDEGLKALNDYLLLLEYKRSSYTKEEYFIERAVTIFYIGSIFYHRKDYFHAVEHLLPIQVWLHKGKLYKELAESERKVSKIWRLNFNEKTIKWDYFSQQNMDNYRKLEDSRQAEKTLQQMAKNGRGKVSNTKIHRVN